MRFQFIQVGSRPGQGKVLLDGFDASSAIQGFTVKSSVRDVTTVTLDAVVLHGADLDMDGEVLIPAPMVALLTQFGWTPPDGAEVRGGAMRLMRVPTKEPEPTLLDELCVCDQDADAPESCPVHGRVHKRS